MATLSSARGADAAPLPASHSRRLAVLLSRQRLLAYARVFVVVFAAWWLFWAATGDGRLDRGGKPIGGDFVTFWAASSIAQDGAPAEIYDIDRLHEAEIATLDGQDAGEFAWHYPPSFLLAAFGLASLPYLMALGVWLAAPGGILLFALRRLLRDPVVLWLGLAFPGTVQNVLQGQTGFLTAGVLGGGLMLLQTRPLLGGAVLGLLSYKPQFAPIVVVALLASRRWSSIAAAGVSAVALAALSYAAFGHETWSAFVADVPYATHLLYDGGLPWIKMPTVTASVLLFGGPPLVAQAVQLLVALGAAAVVAWLWRSAASWNLRCAGVCLGTLLATPFAFDYDLTVLGLGLLWFGLECRASGWCAWEREVVIAGWLSPVLLPVIAMSHLGLGPVVVAALLWLVVRRAAGAKSSGLEARDDVSLDAGVALSNAA